MSASRPDHERRATYEAEIAAFDGTDLEAPVVLDELVAYAARIVKSSWWRGPAVRVVAARSDARTSATRCAPDLSRPVGGPLAPVEIRLAPAGRTVATLAHELAHALVGVDRGHDARFRRAALDLVAVVSNLDPMSRRGSLHVDALREQFERFGLGVSGRTWPDPTSDEGPTGNAGRAIAL